MHKKAKDYENHLNTVMLVFIRKALSEHCQMSTHLPWFHSFLSFFASFCIAQVSLQQRKGYYSDFSPSDTLREVVFSERFHTNFTCVSVATE